MTDLSRREFNKTLSGLIAGGAAVSYQKRFPARVLGNTPSPSNPDLLQPSDITYLGTILMPEDDPSGAKTRWGTSYAGLTGRRVAGAVRLFMTGGTGGTGDYNSIQDACYEVESNGVGQRATLIRNWGDLTNGAKYQTIETTNRVQMYNMWWDEPNQYLWWVYGSTYISGAVTDPCLGMTQLNDATGGKTQYGPWRTNEASQKTKGYIVNLPAAFANAHTNGNRMCLAASCSSQNGVAPRGCVLFAVPNFNPLTLPADNSSDSHVSLMLQRILYSDRDYPQYRPSTMKVCGWINNYVDDDGAYLDFIKPNWNDEGITVDINQALDVLTASVWIKTPTKEGLLYVGQMVDLIAGHDYSTTTDPSEAYPHCWYGPENHPIGGAARCPHGQLAGVGQNHGTGPKCGSLVDVAFIHDPAVLAQAASGAIATTLINPAVTTRMSAFPNSAIANEVGDDYKFGGAWFDSTDYKLYVSDRNVETVGEGRPGVHVFQIAHS